MPRVSKQGLRQFHVSVKSENKLQHGITGWIAVVGENSVSEGAFYVGFFDARRSDTPHLQDASRMEI